MLCGLTTKVFVEAAQLLLSLDSIMATGVCHHGIVLPRPGKSSEVLRGQHGNEQPPQIVPLEKKRSTLAPLAYLHVHV